MSGQQADLFAARLDGMSQADAHALWAQATSAWPDVDPDPRAFADRIAVSLASGTALAGLEATDLYLASACTGGDRFAVAALTRSYAATVRRVAQGRSNHRLSVAEIEQAVWVRLLVGDAPKIGEYVGRGKLRNWIRVVAHRVRADLIRRQAPAVGGRRAWLELTAAADAPDLSHLRRQYAREFEAAFAAAVRGLEPAQRNLLRQRLVHRLPLARIASILRVHEATVKRRVARARAAIVESTQRILLERLGATPSSWAGIFGLVVSRLDVSVRRLLQSADPQATP